MCYVVSRIFILSILTIETRYKNSNLKLWAFVPILLLQDKTALVYDVLTGQINETLSTADMRLPYLSKKECDRFRQFWQHSGSVPLLELGERSVHMPFKDDPLKPHTRHLHLS